MSREQAHGATTIKRAAWFLIFLLAGCATSQQAPVIERAPQGKKAAPTAKQAPAKKTPSTEQKTPSTEKDSRPDEYIVKKGDTLHSIGLEFGYDYKDVAQWNNINPPYVIHVGQLLKMKDPKAAGSTPAEAAQTGVAIATPIKSEPPATSRPIGEIPLKTEPKAIKEPYSEQAMAAPAPAPKPAETGKTEAPTPSSPAVSADDDALDWAWPAQGKVLSGFNESAGSKGMDIAGTQGQPVFAAAAGKVVYSGNGLRGYGKLVIVKHNKTYLSAYAHNSQILVKEGQEVTKGQKIAEMGSTDTDQVKLHFEIRKLGKPIDPAKYLPDRS